MQLNQILSEKNRSNYSYCLSNSGLTNLLSRSSHSRFTGSKSVKYQHNGIIINNNLYATNEATIQQKKDNEKRKTLPKKKKQKKEVYPTNNTIPIKNKGLNKQVIRDRIVAQINAQTGTKKLYFFTITFPCQIKDNVAYRCLNNWLTQLREKKLLSSYLWVAERQQNNTIHYHIAIPQYLNVRIVNDTMKQILKSERKKQQLFCPASTLHRYNGIDISKNRKTKRITNFAEGSKKKSLVNYLTKYITKNQTISEHLVWHCSRDYSSLMLRMWVTDIEALYLFGQVYEQYKPQSTSEHHNFFKWKDKPPDFFTFILGMVNKIILLHELHSKQLSFLVNKDFYNHVTLPANMPLHCQDVSLGYA